LEKGVVCVMILDIDKFKRINDTYGHQEGDRVIISIVDIVNKSIRDTDIFARVGGEEFGILLKCKDKNEAMIVAERIRKNVEIETTVPNRYDLKEKMTISIGVYYSKADDVSADKVVSYADAALYEAKNSGRNKVFYYYN
ncbi:GGDEF domain-containing protein, partial [Salmonella enterica subsp. enterica serovar Solt]|nr:GGDEF domain-containing protein [Salmonella enterica subsp. enterica serovar Solt]